MSNTVEDDTTVNESYSVTVPASVREEADLEAGDRLRWRVEEDGTLSVAVLKRQSGAFADLDPVHLEEATDATADHDAIGGDY